MDYKKLTVKSREPQNKSIRKKRLPSPPEVKNPTDMVVPKDHVLGSKGLDTEVKNSKKMFNMKEPEVCLSSSKNSYKQPRRKKCMSLPPLAPGKIFDQTSRHANSKNQLQSKVDNNTDTFTESKYTNNVINNMCLTNTTRLKQSSKKERMPSPPEIITGDINGQKRVFRKDQLLGTGGFARVYQVTDTVTGAKYANKVINKMMFAKKDNARLKVEREIEIHKLLSHDNIVQFSAHFEDQDFMHILLELCPQNTLLHVSKYRRTITENEVKFYSYQILEGVCFIHNQKILHRDLKLGNMFLSAKMQVKIGDFGLATTFADNQPGNLCGTPNYIAPEVLAKYGHSVASEVWSIGCMVFALLAGTPPFETESVSKTYNMITKGIYNLPPTLSQEAKDFVKAMLCQDPKDRGHISPHPMFCSRSPSLKTHLFMTSGQMSTSFPSYNSPSLISGKSKLRTIQNLNIKNVVPSPPLPKVKFLDKVISLLTNCLSSSAYERKEDKVMNLTPVFVTKWVDYSNKFGFVYKMTNGGIGVKFNDKTTMTTIDKKSIEFIDQEGIKFKLTREKVNQMYPELANRVDILFIYEQYMEEKLADASISLYSKISDKLEGKTVPNLLQWNIGATFVCMEFDIDVIQVNSMQDHWKLVLSQNQEKVQVTTVVQGKVETVNLSAYCPQSLRGRLISVLQDLKIMALNDQVSK